MRSDSVSASSEGQSIQPAGLCASCRHVRRVATPRGSVFYLCRRSETDSRFVKYPPLPIWTCVGYELDKNEFPAGEA